MHAMCEIRTLNIIAIIIIIILYRNILFWNEPLFKKTADDFGDLTTPCSLRLFIYSLN